MKETDLYQPVKKLFEKMGYTVNGEVKDMDVTAVRGEELVVIELKTGFNATLLIQAVKRQRITEQVYVAIPRPSQKSRFSKSFKDKEYLLRRLSLGLILVALDSPVPYASIAMEPKPFNEKASIGKSKAKKTRTLKEIENRHGDFNTGGSTGMPIVTAYRENVLKIAGIMEIAGTVTCADLKNAGCGAKTYAILNRNYYGWFKKCPEGRYRLTEKAPSDMEDYRELINLLIDTVLTTDNRIIHIRKAKISEAKALSKQAAEEGNPGSVTRDYIRDNHVFVAEVDQALAGFWSMAEHKEDRWADDDFLKAGWWLEHFIVQSDFKECGIERRMIEHAKETARERGIAQLFVRSNLSPKHLYGKIEARPLSASETDAVGGDARIYIVNG